MIVNHQNIKKIFSEKKLNFHDYYFEDLIFEHDDTCFYKKRENRIIKLLLLDPDFNDVELLFHGVIGCEFSSCEFWGPSPHIACVSYLEDERKIVTPKLFKRFKEIPEKDRYLSLLNASKTYIEIKIQLISGDVVLIVCESFELS